MIEMKKNIKYRLIVSMVIFLLSSNSIGVIEPIKLPQTKKIKPIYDNIWGTIYHAEVRQCDKSPTKTGDGTTINPHSASEQRIIAISQEMLGCEYRTSLINDSTSVLYKGMIEYGDTVWIQSPNIEINGWWIVHDTKNSRYRNTIDFLQTKGDGSLYNNDKLWNGKFDDIEIFAIEDAEELGLTDKMT